MIGLFLPEGKQRDCAELLRQELSLEEQFLDPHMRSLYFLKRIFGPPASGLLRILGSGTAMASSGTTTTRIITSQCSLKGLSDINQRFWSQSYKIS